ncbi:MAG: hypothetical protein AAF555_05210 [Verrucomicrobiota bacterium]
MTGIRTSLLALGGLIGLSSCALVPGSTRVPPEEQIVGRHHFYHEPRQPDLRGSYLWGVAKANPNWWWKNSDTPLAEWWRPEEPDQGKRQRSWYRRNPLHNFTHYIVGVSDRPFVRRGIEAAHIWNQERGLNLAVLSAGPLLHLPFVSYQGRLLECYLGWRESGNFGAALRTAEAD